MRFLILSLFLILPISAQEENVRTRASSLFGEDKPEKAFALLNEHLKTNPNDSDARVLVGLICSWDKRYDEGRRAFRVVLDDDPDYKDAVLGLINLELWSGQSERAEELAKQGLTLRPKDPDYQAALAKVQASRKAAAADPVPAAAGAETKNPKDETTWETGLAQSNIWYSDKRSSWHETAATVSRNTSIGWITARFSHASWFGEGSNLIEIESYPRIRPGTYGFIEGAFSPDATLYARRRFGAEIFQNLPKGFEASAGIRYMRFGATDTILYTGSVGKYFGNWWLLGRTFVSPDSLFGASKSLQVSGRRYFKDADHFLGFRFGIGASPFEIRSVNEYDVQKSTSAAFESLWRFKNGLRFRVTTGAARQTRLGLIPLWQFQADGTLYYSF